MQIKNIRSRLEDLAIGVVKQVNNKINQSGEKCVYYLLKLNYDYSIINLLLTQNEILRVRRIYAPQLINLLAAGYLYDYETCKITTIVNDGNMELIAITDSVINAASARCSKATGEKHA